MVSYWESICILTLSLCMCSWERRFCLDSKQNCSHILAVQTQSCDNRTHMVTVTGNHWNSIFSMGVILKVVKLTRCPSSQWLFLMSNSFTFYHRGVFGPLDPSSNYRITHIWCSLSPSEAVTQEERNVKCLWGMFSRGDEVSAARWGFCCQAALKSTQQVELFCWRIYESLLLVSKDKSFPLLTRKNVILAATQCWETVSNFMEVVQTFLLMCFSETCTHSVLSNINLIIKVISPPSPPEAESRSGLFRFSACQVDLG